MAAGWKKTASRGRVEVFIMRFFNQTKGVLTSIDEVIFELSSYINDAPERQYRIAVGSDGEGYNVIDFPVAITIHRVGQGGRFFITRVRRENINTMQQKIHTEAWLACEMGMLLKKRAAELECGDAILRHNIEIHIDVGEGGPTKSMIKEVVGMARGLGFDVFIKPESAAASNVADRFSAPFKSGHVKHDFPIRAELVVQL